MKLVTVFSKEGELRSFEEMSCEWRRVRVLGVRGRIKVKNPFDLNAVAHLNAPASDGALVVNGAVRIL
jgi:hypothetical protein